MIGELDLAKAGGLADGQPILRIPAIVVCRRSA